MLLEHIHKKLHLRQGCSVPLAENIGAANERPISDYLYIDHSSDATISAQMARWRYENGVTNDAGNLAPASPAGTADAAADAPAQSPAG